MKDFKLPDLGENVAGGDIVQVLVKEGDVIKPEQPVVEIETDKAVVEVPCSFGGRIAKVYVEPGQKIKVGAPLVSVDEDGSVAAAGVVAEAPTQASGSASTGATPAAQAAAEETAAPPRGGKAAPPASTTAERRAGAPPAPTPGAAAASPQEAPEAVLRPQPAAATPVPVPQSKVSRPVGPPPQPRLLEGEPVPAGPATRRLARELGVDLREVAATFPGERLTEEHVKRFVKEHGTAEREAPAGGMTVAGVQAPALPDFEQWGAVERVPFSSVQRKTAEHLSAAWLIAPHVTQFDEADVTSLEDIRKRFQQNAADKSKPVKLTVTAFILKAASVVLKQYPQFNSTLDMAAGQLVLKRYYHIGVAVDTEAGLIVPVLRDVDKKSIIQIANEMNEIAERTRKRKIGLEELRGGTFTVTNLGGIGGTGLSPIINYPEVAILGVARSREVPVVRNGQLGTRQMLPLSLSYDHRVINGADGARFLRKVAALLEDPELLLLEG